jgi:glycosyltransferase involved in cell wall biosynthesis
MKDQVSSLKSIGIIIPTYNDYEELANTIPRLIQFWDRKDIMIVDASNDDRILKFAQQYEIPACTSPIKQRASQMNLGAKKMNHDILLFLHADTQIPKNSAALISSAIGNGNIGGAFYRVFDSPSLLLYFTCLLSKLRGILTGIFLGDQAIFIVRKCFDNLGRYPFIDSFEDLEISLKMKEFGKTHLITTPIISSARRFQRKGPLPQTLLDLWATIKYFQERPEFRFKVDFL